MRRDRHRLTLPACSTAEHQQCLAVLCDYHRSQDTIQVTVTTQDNTGYTTTNHLTMVLKTIVGNSKLDLATSCDGRGEERAYFVVTLCCSRVAESCVAT